MDPNSMRNKFIKFVKEVILHALQLAGVRTPRFQLLEETESFFTPEFARDLYRYRCAIDNEFATYTRTIPIRTLLDHQTLMQWMQNGESECFNCTPNPMRGALRYMAFLVDICIYLYRFHRAEVMEIILMRIGLVFDTFLSEGFAYDATFPTLAVVLARVEHEMTQPKPLSCIIAALKEKIVK